MTHSGTPLTRLLCVLVVSTIILSACDNSQPAGMTPTPGPTMSIATPNITPTTAMIATITTPQSTLTLGETSPTDLAATPQGILTGTMPAPTGSVVDRTAAPAISTVSDNQPSPTPVTATSTGAEITALQALASLKPKALAWQSDARFALLSNVRPGQQKNVLGSSLGDPSVNETTPGGKGSNWTLVVFSPSANGAIAVSIDGTQIDLVKQGGVNSDMVNAFAADNMSYLSLSALDLSKMVDSDKVLDKAGARGKSAEIGVALLAPDGLGLGPLPTPQAGGSSPQLAYEMFGSDPAKQTFIFFDAMTGEVVLDSSAP
ncbi:MAG: hypothetical protein IVW55_01495 [Chloroflexi bacterium]|nr:hypothetical protein [Chloroflexota bacterium]